MAADERFWGQLLPLLDEGRIVPVVGPELVQVEVDGQRMPLYEHLAVRLAQRLGVSTAPGEVVTLNEVACRYLADRGHLEDIYPMLKEEMAGLTATPVLDALRQLAGIDAIRLFVSTTFDDGLRQAVDDVRFGGQPRSHSLAFALNSGCEDLPDVLPKLERPVIYQLLGRVSAIQTTYAVTDEDVLEFVHNLQLAERRPPRLFDAMTSNHLLLIGGRYVPWVARFLLRAMKDGGRLWTGRGRAAFVADRVAGEDAELLHFLRHYSDRTLVHSGNDPIRFVEELAERWRRRRPSPGGPVAVPARPSGTEGMPRDAVFLSYASEDRDVVRALKTGLDAKGIDAWFDRVELTPGVGWAERIAANIDAAAAFVPVISRSVLQNGAREFRREWEAALKARERRPRSRDGGPAVFIVPVVVDGTSMTTPGVQEYFAGTQAVDLPTGVVTDEFCLTMQRLVRAAQIGPGAST